MKKIFQNKYRTETIRLKHHDYLHGMYFVTICTKNFEHVFGKIINGVMILNKFGEIVKQEWMKTEEFRKYVILNEYVIMPNHFHGIITIINSRDMAHIKPKSRDMTRHVSTERKFSKPIPKSLSSIIRLFKSSCTREIRITGFTEFKWQSLFYEHIINNDKEYKNIQNYIIENPKKWENDKYFKKVINE